MAPQTYSEEIRDTNSNAGLYRSPTQNGPQRSTYANNSSASIPTLQLAKSHDAKPQYRERSPYITPAKEDEELDLICVGFGPASLAVAVAMHDALASGRKLRADGSAPKVLFIEKQHDFAWHAGMLLPGAKMQISFVKDLASLRDPRSEFTFLNYLHRQGRLVDFTNLGTFLPARSEYEDYMRWAASFFKSVVHYGHEVVSVSPDNAAAAGADSVRSFTVKTKSVQTGQTKSFRGRNVLFATGGQPSLPQGFPQRHPRVIHSSQYAKVVPQLLRDTSAPYRVAVLGAGQSAAEIFSNIQKMYPNSETRLIMRQEFLRPSDDSPFVNSVFNPDFIDSMFPRSAKHRHNLLTEARATNYGVVRLELVEEIYERMYDQRRELGPDERSWPHRILGGRKIKSIVPSPTTPSEESGGPIILQTQDLDMIRPEGVNGDDDSGVEEFQADIVIAATGYQRTAHVDMLQDAWCMLPKAAPGDAAYQKGVAGWNVDTDEGERKLAVGRNYKVQFSHGAVADGSGVWLQGCCEGTHGLSDTLLSVLSTRSGEIVDSIFNQEMKAKI